VSFKSVAVPVLIIKSFQPLKVKSCLQLQCFKNILKNRNILESFRNEIANMSVSFSSVNSWDEFYWTKSHISTKRNFWHI